MGRRDYATDFSHYVRDLIANLNCWTWDTSGHYLPAADTSYDAGWSGGRGRNLYAGGIYMSAEVTAAAIGSAAAPVNTSGKQAGELTWDLTNIRMMRARGSGATATWNVIDGSASVVPA